MRIWQILSVYIIIIVWMVQGQPTKQIFTANACMDSTNFTTQTFNPPQDGTIYGIKLAHTSGSVNCNAQANPANNWGCHSISTGEQAFSLEMVKQGQSQSAYYPTTTTTDVSAPGIWADDSITCAHIECTYRGFLMSHYNLSSPELILMDMSTPYTVYTSDVFSLQYSEGCCEHSNVGNSGSTCADVYFYYLDTDNPTNDPSYIPTMTPTLNPTLRPSNYPSLYPSQNPTNAPSYVPTLIPTQMNTNTPTLNPTMQPSNNPTQNPTKIPNYSGEVLYGSATTNIIEKDSENTDAFVVSDLILGMMISAAVFAFICVIVLVICVFHMKKLRKETEMNGESEVVIISSNANVIIPKNNSEGIIKNNESQRTTRDSISSNSSDQLYTTQTDETPLGSTIKSTESAPSEPKRMATSRASDEDLYIYTADLVTSNATIDTHK